MQHTARPPSPGSRSNVKRHCPAGCTCHHTVINACSAAPEPRSTRCWLSAASPVLSERMGRGLKCTCLLNVLGRALVGRGTQIRLMQPPNATWQQIIAQATQSPEVLKAPEVVRNVQNILQTNCSVASSLGPPFLSQMSIIYMDMLNVYKCAPGHTCSCTPCCPSG